MGEPLMTIPQTAERLGVTVRFVRRLVAERRIPHYKVGHFIRFDPTEVNTWLRDQHRPGDAA
jgi:excisionase family DNA binding protein